MSDIIYTPISQQRRTQLKTYVELKIAAPYDVAELFAEAEYWRGVVRESYEYIDESDGIHDPECQYCNGKWISTLTAAPGTEARLEHTDDCAWRRAQE